MQVGCPTPPFQRLAIKMSLSWRGPAGGKVHSQPVRTLQGIWQVYIKHSWKELRWPSKVVAWVLCPLTSQKYLNFG